MAPVRTFPVSPICHPQLSAYSEVLFLLYALVMNQVSRLKAEGTDLATFRMNQVRSLIARLQTVENLKLKVALDSLQYQAMVVIWYLFDITVTALNKPYNSRGDAEARRNQSTQKTINQKYGR
jgi:hypothetical protein